MILEWLEHKPIHIQWLVACIIVLFLIIEFGFCFDLMANSFHFFFINPNTTVPFLETLDTISLQIYKVIKTCILSFIYFMSVLILIMLLDEELRW